MFDTTGLTNASDGADIGAVEMRALIVKLNADTANGSCGANCTLRDALTAANANGAGLDDIIFDNTLFSASQTITVLSALPDITSSLTLNGTGANLVTVRRDTGGDYRIFTINSGQTVTLAGLTITGGNVTDIGGGIWNSGTLTVTNCQISGNTASNFGGDILNSGTLTVTGSTIANNSANGDGTGGGIDSTGISLTLLNSTISGNSATNAAGGNGGGIWTQIPTSITNCTITNNSAAGANSPGGIRRHANTTTIRNSLIAANQNNTTVPDVIANGNTGITSSGFNLISNVGALGGVFNRTGDQTGTGAAPLNPLLAVLGAYGGPTQTHALLPGSPAINAGTNTDAPATDQRGFTHPQQTIADIGAYEARGFTLALTSGNSQSAGLNTAFAIPLVVKVTSANSEPVQGGRVSFTPPGAGASAVLTGNPATIAANGQASGTATANYQPARIRSAPL